MGNSHVGQLSSKQAEISQTNSALDALRKEHENIKKELEEYKNQKLPDCIKEKETMQAELDKVKATDDKGRLDKTRDLGQAQEKKCDKNMCNEFIVADRDEVLDEIYQAAGV